ncbi:MAG: DMT family transporter [Gemmatimonadaceae bacterium]
MRTARDATTPLTAGWATLAIMGASFGFASIAIATVLATRAGTTLTTIVAGRFLLAGMLIAPIVGVRALSIGRARAVPLLVQCGFGQVLINMLALSALAYISAASAVFLFYTYPAWVAVFAAVRGSERIGTRRAGALLLSLAGLVVMIGLPGGETLHPLGVGFALAGAVVYAVYIPLLGRLQQRVDPLVATFYIAIGVVLLLAVVGAIGGQLQWQLPLRAVGAIAWMAVVSTLFAFTLFMRGLATLGPVQTSIVATVEPFFAALLAAAVLGQPIRVPTLIGGTLIALAVILLQRPTR